MLYQGASGWIRPTRLAPEASPSFSAPGGSVESLRPIITEQSLNGRLEGLGCGCSRITSMGSAAGLDMNRRESFGGLRGGLGVAYKASDACDAVEGGRDFLICSAIEWANYAMGEAADITQAALAIGGPGAFGGFTPNYYSLFSPLQARSRRLVNDYVIYEADLPADVKKKVHDAVRDTNAGIKAVFDGLYEESTFQYIYNTLLRTPAFMYETASSTAGSISKIPGVAVDVVSDIFDFSKYAALAVGGVLLFALYGRARG